tara:strand:+ start:986 stop:1288 length:303 start_codon:yes stop_codon:yes gene_type:complete
MTKMKLAVISIATALFTVLSTTAYAEERCMPSVDTYKNLTDYHGESRVGYGLSGEILVETWANLDTGTWTTFATSPNGTSCLLAAGDQYAVVQPVNPPNL